MTRLARYAVANPRRVLAVWGVFLLALAPMGMKLEQHLHRSDMVAPGTMSAAATTLEKQRFGENSTLVILLEGDRAALDVQGPRLAAALDRRPSLTVLGPWQPGGATALRPAPDKVMLLVRSDRPFDEVSRIEDPAVRAEVGRDIRPPVQAHVSGYADIVAGVHESTLKAISKAEFMAGPLLMLILLFVFRGVVAAALPLLVGIGTIGAGRGVLDLVNRALPLDAVALNLTSMMGLALGVDYALLLVSRYREELAAGADPKTAALTAVERAGHTLLFAGIAFGAAMATAITVAPGDLLRSAAFGVVVAVGLSIVGALTALPAALSLLGHRVNKWTFGSGRQFGSGRWAALALRALRRPALAAGLVLLVIAGLAAPALAVQSGPLDPGVLPASSVERQDYTAIKRALGQGWAAPYEIVVAAKHGRITDPARLAALDRWQQQVAARPDVTAVLGLGQIAQRTRGLGRARTQLRRASTALARAPRDQRRLVAGLDRADRGVQRFRTGLQRAAEGASELAAGGSQASGGAAALQAGLAQAASGSRQLNGGLATASAAAGALASGARRAREGAVRVASGLARAHRSTRGGLPQVRELEAGLARGAHDLAKLRGAASTAQSSLDDAQHLLDGMLAISKADPSYKPLYTAVATARGALSGRNPITGATLSPGYDGMDAALADASAATGRAASGVRTLLANLVELDAGLARLEGGARQLASGTARIASGAARLEAGLHRLSGGGGTLLAGIERLQSGAGALAAGVDRLDAGAGTLNQRLAQGSGGVRQLAGGVDRLRQGAVAAQIRTKGLGAPGNTGVLLDSLSSGYFVLAAMDRSGAAARRSATFAVNLDRGGSAAQLLVIGQGDVSRYGHPLRGYLDRRLRDLERHTGTVALLGGPATTMQDFDKQSFGTLWELVLSLVLVTYLVLAPVLRSLVLPLLAIVLNLVTVAAAFGVLSLLFQGHHPLLGGPGFIDSIMLSGVLSIVFGLSIDYEVFLLARMREGYLTTGTTEGAIRYGIRHTAGIVTGAALIMTGVFVAFAMSNLSSMRQLGIGLTVAVLLDATLVRLVLLPAAIKLVGDRAWWAPRWMTRLLDRPRAPREERFAHPNGNGNGNGNGLVIDREVALEPVGGGHD